MVCPGPKCWLTRLLYCKYMCTQTLNYPDNDTISIPIPLLLQVTTLQVNIYMFIICVCLQSKDKMRRGSRRGCITLRKAIVGIDDEDNCTFTIHSDGRTYHFQGMLYNGCISENGCMILIYYI